MIPESILIRSLKENIITPRFLGPEDIAWLSNLIEEFIRFEGRPRRDLLARLKEPFHFSYPRAKFNLACLTIKRKLWSDKDRAPSGQPRLARAKLFTAAHALGNKEQALKTVANQFGVSPEELIRTLFDDLQGEKPVVVRLLDGLDPTELIVESNLLLVKALLSRSRHVTLDVFGRCRPVIRQAKLRGLICVVESKSDGDGFRLSVSGPFSLFRHTLVYGRHLGELLPFLQACDKFSLEAVCIIKSREAIFRLSSGAPIAVNTKTNKFDSKIEQRFARDFMKLAPDWDLIREPEPVVAGPQLLFPDFAARYRPNPQKHWFIEIVGYWSAEYLRGKFEKLQAANLSNFIVCIDKRNSCGQTDAWESTGARVVEFAKHLKAELVLSVILQDPD